ncbi:MAG: MSHA biogenesis protein MshQ [Motiliproteus sp.]|jgi:MSHA biogenesis protein MshQ
MNYKKQLFFIPILCVLSSAQAATPELDAPLDSLIIYSGDYLTTGEAAKIYGNATAGAAMTLGASGLIDGNAQAEVALTLGASAIVNGNAQAGTAAVTLEGGAVVEGDATAGAAVTVGAGARVGGKITEGSAETFEDQQEQLHEVQVQLRAMRTDPGAIKLPASISHTTLKKGIYYTETEMTTVAGSLLTFDGEGEEGHWLIHSESYIALGASTKILLENVTPGSTITWNSNTYISAGANAELLGTFFADTYISTGTGTTLEGIGGTCGGLLTTNDYVSLGAGSIIGAEGCGPRSIAQIDHYRIIHDGQGLTCDAETVTIEACTNADEGSCTLSTDTVTLDVKATGPSSTGSVSVTDNITFTGRGTASIAYTRPEPTLLSLDASITATNPTVCSKGSTASCELVFADAGFIFLNGSSGSSIITNQIAGTTFPLRLQAVANNNGVCESLLSGNKAIDFSQKNVAPGGVSGLSFSIGGNDIAKYSDFTSTGLVFDAEGIAEIPTPLYKDAGQIRLYAQYDLDGVTISGSSNAFWVSPYELVVSATSVSATSGTTVLNGATATATPTHKAGADFTLTLTAINSLGDITPNYSSGQIQLKLGRAGPTLSGSVDGELTYAAAPVLAISTSAGFQDVTLTGFSSGLSSYAAARYSEVGLLTLDVQDSDYGNAGIVVPATTINIGRFIPDHFTQTVVDAGVFHTTYGSGVAFTAYSGQKDEATNSVGAISYLTSPILAITAYNKQGAITQNYYEDEEGSANDYMKLIGSDISISVPTSDRVATGSDGNILPLTATMYPGTLSQYDTTVFPSVALPRGVLHYHFSAEDNFFYNRSANARVAPFTSAINFSIATLKDADDVSATSTADASPTGVEIRFGRLLLKNSSGPEMYNIPQPLQLEYFNGDAFSVVTDDNFTRYDAGKIALTNISLDPALTAVLGGEGAFLAGKTQALELEAPGEGKQGEIGVFYDAYEWLKYDWDNDGAYDDSPSAVASFGEYRGNDGIIYQAIDPDTLMD